MRQRKHISLRTQLAAALCQLRDESGNLLIPYEHAKFMTEDQVLSLFQRDHYPVRKTDGGLDVHYNLVFLFIGPHRIKTAKVDQPEIAKSRRIRNSLAAFNAHMAARGEGLPRDPERGPKIRSRGFDRTKTRKFDGTVTARK